MAPYVISEFEKEFHIEAVPNDGEAVLKVTFQASGSVECESREGKSHFTLHVPVVIGTGMDGWGMKLARRVRQGLYFRSPKPTKLMETPIKVVHALDVARAVKMLMQEGKSGDYWLDDGSETTVDALAGALSHRLNDKRVPLFPNLVTKVLCALLPLKVPSIQVTGTPIEGFERINVVTYLSTHHYGPEDI